MKLTTLIGVVALCSAGVVGYDAYRKRDAAPPQVEQVAAPVPVATATAEDRSWIKPRDGERAAPAASGGGFKCDGRTHCSHMRSCEEATYFIQHCPNTQMDGDRDGVPCEQQWC